MILSQPTTTNLYEEIQILINEEKYTLAEIKLNSLSEKTSEWHFLYSFIMISKSWFDSAKKNLETAMTMAPDTPRYQEAFASLMARYNRYSDDYYRRPYSRRRNGCCCCCCDGCCEFSCCDLICLDSCCECMGGDLIECI